MASAVIVADQPADEALKPQRPLPDGTRTIVATSEKEDAVAHAAA